MFPSKKQQGKSSKTYKEMKSNDLLFIKPFVSWCASQGIISPLEIRVRPEDGYRYVCMSAAAAAAAASSQLQQQQPKYNNNNNNNKKNIINLIQCPLNGKASLIASSMEELADRLEFEASLGQDSHFYPYIQVLPPLANFASMPRFWSPEQLDFVSQFDDGLLAREYLSTASSSPLSTTTTTTSSSSSSLWARAVVDSRANHLPYDGSDGIMSSSSFALTPFLDMINHDGNIITSAHVEKTSSSSGIYQDNKGAMVDILHLDIQDNDSILRVGDEVKTSYGKLTNIEMILNYGFCETKNGSNNNPWNRESFYVRTLSHPKPILVTCLDKDGSVDRMSLGAVRKSLATTAELAMAERLLGRQSTSRSASNSNSSIGQRASSSPTPSIMTMVPFLSKRNEEETYALIAGFMDDAVYLAKKGAQEALQIKASLESSSSSSLSSTSSILQQYDIIADYLMGRACTLQNSLNRINVLLEHAPLVFQAQEEQALLLLQQQQ